jgi:putative transposase
MSSQAAVDRAWQVIVRFYDNCRKKKTGKKGYPRFQHDHYSVEYKTMRWRLEPDGKRLTFTDGMAIVTVRILGARALAACPVTQIKRVRLLKRADASYVQFAVQAERQQCYAPIGTRTG